MDERHDIRLLTRGDDLGVFPAVNRAIVDAFEHGILRNTSLMVPAPGFQHAAHLVKQYPDLCLGLHITLTSEWDAPRWGPVSPPETVPSLVDQDGSFFRTTDALFHRGINIEEAIREVKAQLERARSYGLNILYLDEHMGIGWVFHPDDAQQTNLGMAFRRLARDENLIWYTDIPGLNELMYTRHEIVDRLSHVQEGTYLMVTHPAYIDAETQQVIGQEYTQPGEFAHTRWLDYQLLCSPEIRHIIDARHIHLVRFDEVKLTP